MLAADDSELIEMAQFEAALDDYYEMLEINNVPDLEKITKHIEHINRSVTIYKDPITRALFDGWHIHKHLMENMT